MNTQNIKVWRNFGIDIYYYPELDGGGRVFAPAFQQFILTNKPYKKVYSQLFEWCAGPGFIGFSLLGAGLCEKLYLADINPLAVECIKKTVQQNNLYDCVSYTCSDNFKAISKDIKFDGVVANPPNYCNLNRDHKFGKIYYEDLRPNDRHWAIHKDFYENVFAHLTDEAILMISEVEPFKTEVMIPLSNKLPYDRRPRPPINDFKEMIKSGGLTLERVKPYYHVEDGPELYMLVSRYSMANKGF